MTLRRGLRTLMFTVALGATLGAPSAHAAYTATLNGTTATLTNGGGGFDSLTIANDGGSLQHSRSGDAGFASNADFDSTVAGVQPLADTAAAKVVINGGADMDLVQLGYTGSVFAASFDFNGGGGGSDTLFPPGLTGADDTVVLSGGTITGAGTGPVAYTDVEQVNLATEGGDDTVRLDATTSAPTNVNAGEGADQLVLAAGASLGGRFRGGAGTDTVDYSAWTTPVAVDLGKTARFVARLQGANEIPPNLSSSKADGLIEFTDLATNTFDLELILTDGPLTSAGVSDSHIHQGVPGTNGPVIYGIGGGGSWDSSTTIRKSDQTNAAITEPALRDGGTYFNVHTAAFPSGELRGQLTLDPSYGYGGTGSGTTALNTVERVIGGSANDTLRGTVRSDFLDGRGGADTLNCGDGADTETSDLSDTLISCETLVGAAIEVTGIDPASPSANPAPKVRGTATPAGAGVRIYANATCTGTPLATGTVGEFTGAGVPVAVTDGTTTLYAAVADTANQSACSATSVTYEKTPTPTPSAAPAPTASPSPSPSPVGTVSKIAPKATGRGAQVTIDTGATAGCPVAATGQCRATATATAKLRSGKKTKTVTLGSSTTAIAANKSSRLTLKVSKSLTKTWRKAGKLKVTVTVRLTVPGGETITQTRTVTIKAPKKG